MNRIWLFLCFLCIPWAAQGQSAYEWNCWFDDDTMPRQSGTAMGDALSIDALANELSEGFHTFHVQVADTAGRYSPPQTQLFYHAGNNSIKKLRYWFDEDEKRIYTISSKGGLNTIDVSHLQSGIHIVYCQVEDAVGKLSDVFSGLFYRQIDTDQLEWSYWFDEDEDTKRMTSHSGETVWIDVSELADGFHTIHHQVRGLASSDVVTRMFIKVPQTENVPDMTCICTVDNKLVSQSKVPGHGGVISWEMDVSSLSVGLHRAQFQVITPAGVASTIAERYFVRVISDDELGRMKCVYSFDNAETHSVQGTASNGLFHLDLDVSALEDGLHRMSYMMVADDGTTTPHQTAFFWKTPLGGESIVQYDYWLNDDMEHVHKAKLDKRENPFKLISLLPVETYPIRSSCFHFEVKDDQPVIYAKNDFHIRFYDTSGREVSETKQYVDYQVKQEVEPVGELQKTQTFPKVSENDIRWYTMQSALGDTAAFRLSQAATLQVFAPSGREVFKTSESTSVQWGGIHTWEEGTYYVAVHDVTGSQSNMTLDYMHMDKYDVVDWDVHTVGNGGCSTITFKGNGFRDLYRVDLYTAAGDSIHSVDISHDSDAETSVTFDFSGAELGVYNAVFHFTQEDKHFTNIVTVEEAVDIELATTVSFPSTFLRGTSTTYTIKVTNKGNMTAYNMPVYTWIMNKSNKNGIRHIEYDGLNLPRLFSGVNMDSLSASEKAELQALSDGMGDGHYFMLFRAEDEDSPGDSVWVRNNYFFTNIAPHETKTLRLTISADEEVWVYFTVPEEWSPVFDETLNAPQTDKARGMKKGTPNYCCYKDKIECAANIVANVTTIANLITSLDPSCTLKTATAIADCVAGIVKQTVTAAGIAFCGDNSVQDSFYDKVKKTLNGISIASTISSCASGFLPLGKVGKLVNGFGIAAGGTSFSFGLGVDGFECVKSFFSKVSGCPPIPPNGGSSSPQPPVDPNDIYGYLSDAGSKFMTDEVAKVNYTIEFENDTAFAQASAHTIVIRDTLDSRYFDLTSFLPTSVKIGKREAFLDETTDVKTAGGVTSFLKTIDMRPEINAIAQVEGEYSQQSGIAQWTFTSLDPMTMDPTDDLMQGILPVNYNGTSGIGEVMFEVGMKPNKGHGTEIKNRASIVFDYEEPILTPTWVNIVDAIAPESHVSNVKMLNDSTAAVCIEATDELSGPWRYNVYVQYGSGTWFLGAENVPIDKAASVRVYEGIDHGFYTIVTDSAGNVEQKEPAREYTFEVFAPQVDTNTKLQLAQGWNWISHNQQEVLSVEAVKPKAQRIVSQTDELYKDSRFGWTGTLDELLPTQMYKVQMAEADEVQLRGRLFNAEFRSVPLYTGWNWIGYPIANTMTPAEAFQKMEAEEGDFIVGQDGMATFTDDHWMGTLMQMEPGLGYLYRSVSDKNLFLNATAQTSSRRANVQRSIENGQTIPEDWTVDKRKYPNVMGLVADFVQDGQTKNASEWLVGAFCGEECRGLSQTVGGHLMMNVYGTGDELIHFIALNRESGEVSAVVESEPFHTDILGTMQQPYKLHSGIVTGIAEMESGRWKIGDAAVYDLQGRRVDKSSVVSGGIYIVNDGNKNQKHVNLKRKQR